MILLKKVAEKLNKSKKSVEMSVEMRCGERKWDGKENRRI